jgi:hypothetical protein
MKNNTSPINIGNLNSESPTGYRSESDSRNVDSCIPMKTYAAVK